MAKNWRRGSSLDHAVTARNTLSGRLWALYLHTRSWRAVAAKFGVSGAMAFRVAHGHEPKDARIRRAFGMPEFAPAPCCQRCGVPHVSKRCTRRPTFDERAAQYDAWLARNADRLRRIVAWAEGGRR